MFKILCITSGKYIHLERFPHGYSSTVWLFNWTGITEDVVVDHIFVNKESGQLFFDTREAADWFIRRRLTYNPKRNNPSKLNFMRSIFRASGLVDWEMTKQEYIIEEDLTAGLLTKIWR